MRTYEVTRGPHYNAEPIIAIPEPHYKHLISCERYRELRQIISSRNHARLEQGFPTWGTCTPGVHLPIRRGISKVSNRRTKCICISFFQIFIYMSVNIPFKNHFMLIVKYSISMNNHDKRFCHRKF